MVSEQKMTGNVAAFRQHNSVTIANITDQSMIVGDETIAKFDHINGSFRTDIDNDLTTEFRGDLHAFANEYGFSKYING